MSCNISTLKPTYTQRLHCSSQSTAVCLLVVVDCHGLEPGAFVVSNALTSSILCLQILTLTSLSSFGRHDDVRLEPCLMSLSPQRPRNHHKLVLCGWWQSLRALELFLLSGWQRE